jgi:acetyl-CoA carboxylase carboxyl transferase subunit beta
MNWLTNFVRPKIKALVGGEKKPAAVTPDNLWVKCPNCEQMLFHRDLETNLQVCSFCNHHLRIGPQRRLELLFDDGQFEKHALSKVVVDPLKFKDRKRYADKLKEAQAKHGEGDALWVASGKMGGKPAVAAVFDFNFMGGSMGIAVGEGIVMGARLAVEKRCPFIVFPASGGARMQEGILSLMQMPRTTVAVQDVKEAGLPYVVVLTDPTTGGVTASFAMLGDIAIAEPGAVIGFAGQRVIQDTIREALPDGFQRAEYLLDHGIIDMVVHRHQLRDTLIRVLALLGEGRPTPNLPAVSANGNGNQFRLAGAMRVK